jgi:hypothetical protein
MDAGLEFHDLLLVVFVDVDIHRLLQNLRQIRDLELPVSACKGFKVELFTPSRPYRIRVVDLCAVNWFGVGAGHGYERGAGAQIRRNLRGRNCNRGALGASRLGTNHHETPQKQDSQRQVTHVFQYIAEPLSQYIYTRVVKPLGSIIAPSILPLLGQACPACMCAS